MSRMSRFFDMRFTDHPCAAKSVELENVEFMVFDMRFTDHPCVAKSVVVQNVEVF